MATEGKTKFVVPITAARFPAKDDITAGDGKMHDILPGKGALATRTTSNVFELLRYAGLPVAYIAQDSPTSFVGYRCDMFPLEVVVRREAHGSFLKRNPDVAKGSTFVHPLVEFYLKTKGRDYLGLSLPCDDPLLMLVDGQVHLHDPAKPIGESFALLDVANVPGLETPLRLAEIAVRAFVTLEVAWWLLGRKLVDMKVELGRAGPDRTGAILLADVIDNDSWRLLDQAGNNVDKQTYRDGGDLDAVLRNYKLVAGWTDLFRESYIRQGVLEVAVNHAPLFVRRF